MKVIKSVRESAIARGEYGEKRQESKTYRQATNARSSP
jgi:hypothetical protein